MESPRVDVVDGQTLVALVTPSTTGYRGLLARVAWSLDGKILYAGNTAGRYSVFAWKNGGRGSLQVFPAASQTIVDVREISDGRIVVGFGRPSLSLLVRKGSFLWQLAAPLPDLRYETKTLKVSPDGKQVLFHFDPKDEKSLAAFAITSRPLDLPPPQRADLIPPR